MVWRLEFFLKLFGDCKVSVSYRIFENYEVIVRPV